MRLLLVDDHEMFREVLAQFLTREGLEIVGQAGDAREAVQMADSLRPDIVVLDLGFRGPSGLAAIKSLKSKSRAPKVLVLTGFDESAYVTMAFRAGVEGYALKTQPIQELLMALDVIGRGGRYVAPLLEGRLDLSTLAATSRSRKKSGNGLLDLLSPREREVFELVIGGHPNDGIANNLFISRKTVETHRSRINRKLDVHSTAELILLASGAGLLMSASMPARTRDEDIVE